MFEAATSFVTGSGAGSATMNGGSQTGESTDSGPVTTQLAQLVPTFDPSVDNVEIWASKVELLVKAWPTNKFTELATRLVLGCKGTAYQKLRLHQHEILVNDESGVKRIVELVGGSWGQIPLEQKFELAEKALYRSQQRADESSDSYLTRCDVVWSELLAKKVDLNELRAYITLRGSKLGSEDKKRVIVESGAEKGGHLEVSKVSAAIRMLGSGFFQDMLGQKRDKNQKTYDHTAFQAEEMTGQDPEEAFWATDDMLDDHVLESLAAEDDEDAALVMQFEDAATELVQSDPELCAYYSSYQDARKRLSEKVRFRGFWSVKKGEKGVRKGKGKGKSKSSLARRIANSYCRICLQKGHWKDECPGKGSSKGGEGTSSAAAPTTFVTTEMPAVMSNLPTSDATLSIIQGENWVLVSHSSLGKSSYNQGPRLLLYRKKFGDPPRQFPISESNARLSQANDLTGTANPNAGPIQISADVCENLFASSGSTGVVDLGASQTVIGDRQVQELLYNLPTWVQSQVKRQPCHLVFRFGNHQTLVSQRALVMPLGDQQFRIAVVPGNTPFLISSAFLKGIKAVIDTDEETLWSKTMQRELKIHRSHKNLFLMDIAQLWEPECNAAEGNLSFVSEEQTPIVPSEKDQESQPQTMAAMSQQCTKGLVIQGSIGKVEVKESSSVSDVQNHSRVHSSNLSDQTPTTTDSPNCVQSHVDQSKVGQVPLSERGSRCGSSQSPDPSHELQGTQSGSHQVREGQNRDEVRGCIPGPQVDGLVCEPLRGIHQGGTREVRDVRGEAPRSGNEERKDSHQGQVPGDSQRGGESDRIGSILMGGHQGGTGVRGGRLQCGVPEPATCDGRQCGSPSGGTSSTECAHVSNGECSAGNPATCQEPVAAEAAPKAQVIPEPSGSSYDDVDFEFLPKTDAVQQTFQQTIQKYVKQFTRELQHVVQKQPAQGRRLDLMEVMCDAQSELTQQVNAAGGWAIRFGLLQGDLNTRVGREKLFTQLVKHRPKHLWYSPICAPWCSWSNYNIQKSIAMYEQILHKRLDHLWQISLGIVLHRFQRSQSSHYHHEQPSGSCQLKVPGAQEIVQHTQRCSFDLCKVGNLRDPQSQMPIRKRLVVQSTSEDLHRQLHRRYCSQDHQHRRIEGNTTIEGQSVALSKYTELYPAKFARQIAKIILHDHTKTHDIFAGDAEEHPTKRRRLSEKLGPEAIKLRFPSIDWQTAMKLADQIAPRVGIKIVEKGPLIDQVQSLCPHHKIHHVVLCRGIDRHVGPSCSMPKGQAPVRRMACIRRHHEDVHVEDEWEPWERLTQKGLRRKHIPARVGMVMFAQPRARNEPGTASADAPILRHDPPEMDQPGPTKVAKIAPQEENRSSTENASTDNTTSEALTEPTMNPGKHDESVSPGEERQVIDMISQKHGPRFLQLSSEEQSWLLKIHRNLGHPGSQKLTEFCRQLGCPTQILQAIPDIRCSTCLETTNPKIARPSAVHEPRDFGEVVSMDGILWSNHKGEQFYFYHFVDQSTTYHTAICVPHASGENACQALLQGWLQWAGPPKLLCIDAGTDLNSEQFQQFLQRHGICSRTCATDAHWQNSRVERHGGILQTILTKMDQEESIDDAFKMSMALMHATATKNQWSRFRGYPPEMLVFGKGIRSVGSVVSDDNRASHFAALQQEPEGQRFRQDLALREQARKAFAQVDNDQALRRALVSRSRPDRGQYQQGDWVMMWKKRGEATGVWEGPLQVIVQEESRVVWVTRMNKLYRVAPEHLRPLSAMEEWKNQQQTGWNSTNSIRPPHGGTQMHNLIPSTIPSTSTPQQNTNETITIPEDENTTRTMNNTNTREHRAQSGTSDPEVEPEVSPVGTGSETPEVPNTEAIAEPSMAPETENASPNLPDVSQVPVPSDDDHELFAGISHEDWIDYVECFSLTEDTVWRFEVDVSQHDINMWKTEDHPQEMAFLVSAAKRQRSEVKMSQLSKEEQQLFQGAKMKEIDSWIATETVAKVLRHQIPTENVMRCRWILTWKPVDQPKPGENKHTAKARLVVLGYEDPLVHEIPRDSPTMSKLSRMLILQTAASRHWDIESFDIKTAFLRGQEQSDRTLGLEPNIELRDKLGLKPNEILKLLKGAYGRVDAPYLWFMELKKGLEELGFVASPFDPCTFVLTCPHSGRTEGLIGVHVDDGLCCGSDLFQKKLLLLSKRFPFGAHKKRNFTFTGLTLTQHDDYSIHVNQQQYIRDIHPITISRERRMIPDSPVTEAERQSLRAIVGSLQYAAVNSRPDICSRLGALQSLVNKAKVETLVEANRTLHEAKQFSDVALKIQPIPMEDIRFLAFSDASFASTKIPDSHQGMMIMSCHQDLGKNKTGRVNPLLWHSKKIQKVAVSTLSAEAMSLANAVDVLSWVRLYWGWLQNTQLPWKKADQALLQLPPAFAAIPPEDHPDEIFAPPDNTAELLKPLPKNCNSIITTDCKSLFDLISRTAPPACQEFRTQLQAKLIKEHLSHGIQIRWVPSAAQVADALTKVMDSTMLRECLKLGKYSLHDEAETLKARSDARTRLQWIRDQANKM